MDKDDKSTEPLTATGGLVEYWPPGPARDEALKIMRLGMAMRRQHRGRKRGVLSRYIEECVKVIDGAPTFEKLLFELEGRSLLCRLRDDGEVLDIDRGTKTAEFNLDGMIFTRKFSALERHFTTAKKNLSLLSDTGRKRRNP